MANMYDVIVIGSGPAGEGAALKSSKEGKKVAIVEDKVTVGGNCIHKGTIPSKALRHAVQFSATHSKYSDFSYPQMLETAKSVIDQQVELRYGFYKRNNIDMYTGRATFKTKNKIIVHKSDGSSEQLTADYFVIATGSRPYRPIDIDFSNPRILDSDKVLQVTDDDLKSITIYGAGVIGCEYASIFRALKIKVNLINTRSQLLSFLDDEIIDALSYHLREQGVRIRHNETYESVVANENEAQIKLSSNKVIKSEYILFAQGRTGNSDKLGLKEIGIEIDSRGSIKVNDSYQTIKYKNIYAVGDIVGAPSLASAAFDQGRFAATHMVTGECHDHLVKYIPTGIYTLPEISSIGRTEKELTSEKIPYEVGHASFKDLARAQITGEKTGMLKIIFQRDTLEILGIHCFGSQASEIIHIGQTIMAQSGESNSLMYFVNTTFNYPTMAEAYRVAALNGLNRL